MLHYIYKPFLIIIKLSNNIVIYLNLTGQVMKNANKLKNDYFSLDIFEEGVFFPLRNPPNDLKDTLRFDTYDSLIARKYAEIYHIMKELQIALSIIVRVNTDNNIINDDQLRLSMFSTSILMYYRCFTPGSRKVHYNDLYNWVDKLDNKLSHTHNRIKEFRNKYISHFDENNYEYFQLPSILVNTTYSSIYGITNIVSKLRSPSNEELLDFQLLVQSVFDRINQEYELIMQQYIDEISKFDIQLEPYNIE